MISILNTFEIEIKEYLYKIHGLVLKSCFMIPELIIANQEGSDKIDVNVSFDVVPKEIHNSVVNTTDLKFSETEMYFHVEGLAHFYIAYGNTIKIEQIERSQMAKLRVYLLGGCMGAVLSQRNIIAIHGSSMLINGSGIIFSGNSGAGKSTITTAFINEGYKFLSDDITAVGKDDSEQFVIHPSYPQQKLCDDTRKIIRYDMCERGIIDPTRSKYAISSISNFMDHEILLNVLINITVKKVNEVAISEVVGNEKIATLLNSIYSINARRHLGIKSDFFKQIVELANKIKIYKLIRPFHGFTMNEQITLVQTVLSD